MGCWRVGVSVGCVGGLRVLASTLWCTDWLWPWLEYLVRLRERLGEWLGLGSGAGVRMGVDFVLFFVVFCHQKYTQQSMSVCWDAHSVWIFIDYCHQSGSYVHNRKDRRGLMWRDGCQNLAGKEKEESLNVVCQERLWQGFRVMPVQPYILSDYL